MSRHRNAMRKVSLCDDDYDDDIAQSYDDTYGVSPGTSDMYTFNRNKETTSLSQFMATGQKILEEEDCESESQDNETMKDCDVRQSLESESGMDMSGQPSKMNEDENFMFDMEEKKEASLPLPLPRDSKRSNSKRRDDFNDSRTDSPKSLRKPTPVKKPLDQANKPSNRTSVVTAMNDLKIGQSGNNEPIKQKVLSPAEKEKLQRAYDEYTAGKEVINLIVIGHVDAGKSTLMGHLLFQLGQVSNKQIHKFKQESQKIGKGSFAFAWVLDETEEERTRGVTIDIAQTKFETDKKMINLLDAPGHKDFIPNMITGAGQADCAILVINSVKGEFETGFEQGGQTREHSLLVKSLGVSQLVVAVNKMDMCDWSRDRFLEICKKMGSFLIKQVGFKETDVWFVPCSGLNGENLTSLANSENLTSWYNAKSLSEDELTKKLNLEPLTLLEGINRFKPGEKPIDKPLRFCISDIFKFPQSSAISLAGKVEAGSVKIGDKISIVPSGESGLVKAISLTNEVPLGQCFAGDNVILNVNNIDMTNISIGNFACDANSTMPVSDKLRAKIVLFNVEMLIKGFPIVFHYKSMNEAGVIKKIVSQLDKSTGEVVKEKPRFLTKGMSAIVEIKINKPLCMELFQNYRELGRFMLRSTSTTIAAGMITEIL